MYPKLKKYREQVSLTQFQLASMAGISRSYYVQIEKGYRGGKLNVEIAKKIVAALAEAAGLPEDKVFSDIFLSKGNA